MSVYTAGAFHTLRTFFAVSWKFISLFLLALEALVFTDTPLAAAALAIGIISLVFLKGKAPLSNWLFYIGLILSQTITICVWKGNVGILLIYFFGRLGINLLSLIPEVIAGIVALIIQDKTKKGYN